ncbi:hypothetical protein D3875_03050 [Deinococcus cavernae]|uniref:Uncharacterized protein n=1 Tax=Deinococcus cavernae TaxID=2320857 RepID=A0A418VFU9_9DEIO|nr:hypothetical protein [Deinococcus cavernae]RJF74990.1 hypothetical protein D3875_03050 [Deinococcus cavernae]
MSAGKLTFLTLNAGEVSIVQTALGLMRRVNDDATQKPELAQLEKWFDPVNAQHGVGRFRMNRTHLILILDAAGIFRGLLDSGVTQFGQASPEAAAKMRGHANTLVERLAQQLKVRPERLAAYQDSWTKRAESHYRQDVARENGTLLDLTETEEQQLRMAVNLTRTVLGWGAENGQAVESGTMQALDTAHAVLRVMEQGEGEAELHGFHEREVLRGLGMACRACEDLLISTNPEIQAAGALIQERFPLDMAVIRGVRTKVEGVMDGLTIGVLPRSQA